MTVKASTSLSDRQEAFARGRVSEGQCPGAGAAIQRGLEMLREYTEARVAEVEVLRWLPSEGQSKPFVREAESRTRVEAMLCRRRTALGLDG